MSSTGAGDLVLIHLRGQPAGYARVEEITPDVKPGWWQVRLLLLQVPRQEVVWILREAYIDGEEFTMGGDALRLERIAPPKPAATPPPTLEDEESSPEPVADKPESKTSNGKVVSLADRRPSKS
jgi:hypothetical protein